MPPSSALPSKLLVLIALAQGLALLLLHQAIDLDFWPKREPQWLFSLYAIAFIAPTMVLLSLGEFGKAIVFRWTLAFSILVFALGYYMGLQATPIIYIKYSSLLAATVVTLCVATFKSLMYMQHFAEGGRLTYSRLFTLSWRNFLTLALSLLFTLCVWGVLMLWAALFKAIKIQFFYDVFTEKWFYYPALALANGFGVIIFRRLYPVIDTITRIQQALMKFLLLILVFVSVIFLAALPFTGLTPLWETGGSHLILWMQALMLFFLNAVYQDDPDVRPYSLWLHRFICAGIALLPVYSAISFYGLSLRVDQYGWSVIRCWGVLLWSVFALFSLGYLWGIIQFRDHWIRRVSSVNVRMGLLVLVLTLLTNTPLLDFRKITVASQMARLTSDEANWKNFDYNYFRRHLAKPGFIALQNLKSDWADKHPRIVVKIDALYSDNNGRATAVSLEDFTDSIEILGGSIPTGLVNAIYDNMSQSPWLMAQSTGYYLKAVDLNADESLDYLFMDGREHRYQLSLYYREGDSWKHRQMGGGSCQQECSAVIIRALKAGNISAQSPAWLDLMIGDQIFQVQ